MLDQVVEEVPVVSDVCSETDVSEVEVAVVEELVSEVAVVEELEKELEDSDE